MSARPGAPVLPALPHAVDLLDRAVGYTRGCLALVTDADLARRTPCTQWDLAALLTHMDDSLAALTEAAALGQVDLTPARDLPPAARLVTSLRLRACALLAAWSDPVAMTATSQVGVGSDRTLAGGALAAVGAVEVAVHGWDVARSCGADRPLPADLARALHVVARDLLPGADRPGRFAAPCPDRARGTGPDADPGARLLRFLGRQA